MHYQFIDNKIKIDKPEYRYGKFPILLNDNKTIHWIMNGQIINITKRISSHCFECEFDGMKGTFFYMPAEKFFIKKLSYFKWLKVFL